jgi:hypothetical protein
MENYMLRMMIDHTCINLVKKVILTNWIYILNLYCICLVISHLILILLISRVVWKVLLYSFYINYIFKYLVKDKESKKKPKKGRKN